MTEQPKSWTVQDHLTGADPGYVALYHAVVAVIEQCGPVKLSVSKTTITFKGTRRGFAGARPTKHSTRSLTGDRRIKRAEPYTKRLWVNHYRVANDDDLDDTFTSWVHEAYRVGQGDHLQR